MNRLSHKVAGAVLATGLLIGVLAGAAPGVGASTLNLLSTTTSVVATQPNGGVELTATVNLELVKGALVTPAGSVNFTAVNENVNEGTPIDLGQATVSDCLLGLPALLSLWHASCTATLDTAFESATLESWCSPWTITATYSGANDLVAKSSFGITSFDSCET